MQIVVRHETFYRYAREVGFGRHRLVLRPREGHDLVLMNHRLTVDPAHTLTWQRDVHDNVVGLADFTQLGAQLSIVNEFTVRRSLAFPRVDGAGVAEVPWPVVYDEREASLVAAYRSANFPDDVSAVRAWLDGVRPAREASDAASLLLVLCKAVNTAVTYRRRMERGVQTPAQTLQLGSGSCRDLATLLMEAARELGLAARFASGYLHGSASEAGRASTHAWAEVYLPGVGWLGLDPTLGTVIDLRHIVVGVSHHPRGVMPVSGTFTGTHADLLEHTVSVKTTATG